MKTRCLNKNDRDYPNWGGRGITICKRWMKFENFFADMGERPSSLHQLDRKNNDGPYCKRNCRWATRSEQMNNTRHNRLVRFRGRTKTLKEWSDELGVSYMMMYLRIFRYGWDAKKAFTKPSRRRTP